MKPKYIFRDEPANCPACRRSVSATRRTDETVTRVSKHLHGSAPPNQDGHYDFDTDGFCPGSGEAVAAKIEVKKRKERR